MIDELMAVVTCQNGDRYISRVSNLTMTKRYVTVPTPSGKNRYRILPRGQVALIEYIYLSKLLAEVS